MSESELKIKIAEIEKTVLRIETTAEKRFTRLENWMITSLISILLTGAGAVLAGAIK